MHASFHRSGDVNHEWRDGRSLHLRGVLLVVHAQRAVDGVRVVRHGFVVVVGRLCGCKGEGIQERWWISQSALGHMLGKGGSVVASSAVRGASHENTRGGGGQSQARPPPQDVVWRRLAINDRPRGFASRSAHRPARRGRPMRVRRPPYGAGARRSERRTS